MQINKKYLFLVFIGICLIITFVFGIVVGRSLVFCKFCPPENVDFSLFWEAWDKVQELYINPQKIDVKEMTYGAISGMVKSLEDPYTIFFKPKESQTFIEDVSGRFEGIGIEIDIREEQLQVIAPLEGTPAQKAGLRPGDKIIKINDTLTADLTIDEAVNLIRGPRDTEVILTISRDEWEVPKEITIKRATIEVPSLKLELKDDIAYIKLYNFSEKVDTDFTKAAIEILKSSAKKIILDLRNNPGGYLQRAQDIAGWFLERGQVVVIEDHGDKGEQKIYRAEGNAKLLEYPMVILLNKGSASASEILAAALKDNRGIKLIGETSYGKGSVQELTELSDGSSIKITIANWLTPNNNLITDVGLEPDIKIEITEEDYKENRDPQLDKAIEVVKEIE